MMRKILAPIQADGFGGCVLAYATSLAFQHNAHVEVAHCRPALSKTVAKAAILPSFMRDDLQTQAANVSDAEERELRNQFEHFSRVLEFQIAAEPSAENPSAYWHEEEGTLADIVLHRGLLADIIVVTKPQRDNTLQVNTLHAALFRTGTPVLMCPRVSKRPDSMGKTVAIAWNGSLQAARAVAMTNDVLQRAETVTILTAGHEVAHGPTAEELQDYLKLRGVEAGIDRFEPKGKIGRELLSHCDALGADLMIMGAYSESHEKEAIFGGNSQTIVDHAEIPVIMVH
ncbi:MAG: universal stress protein [Alphaproteobacteria bacterium]|nr:universal stress protein [Alphaproteobacteria bacterium]